MTTDSFIAQRRVDGEVWISRRTKIWTSMKNGYLLPIKIPADKCRELALLLCPELESFKPELKVDYTLCAGEPE